MSLEVKIWNIQYTLKITFFCFTIYLLKAVTYDSITSNVKYVLSKMMRDTSTELGVKILAAKDNFDLRY